MIELRGSAIALRAFRPEESGTVLRALRTADPTVAIGAVSDEELRLRVEASGEMTPKGLLLAIEAGGRVVGALQAYRSGLPSGTFGLGIDVFDGGDRGKGYGSEAVALLVDHLFSSEAARRVEAGTASDNGAMRRVLERLGFVREGVLRGFYPSADGGGVDCVMYGMTRNDWEAATIR